MASSRATSSSIRMVSTSGLRANSASTPPGSSTARSTSSSDANPCLWAAASSSARVMSSDRHRSSCNRPVQALVLVQKTHDQVVHEQERDRTDDPTRNGIIIADDGVLHRVGQRQQDDEVEGIELRELALPGHPQAHDEKHVDHQRAQNLRENRLPWDPEIGPVHAPSTRMI